MKQMKLHLIFFAGIILMFPGCEDDLKQEPQGTYPVSAFFQTEEHAKLAITSCYQQISFSDSKNRSWVFAEVASDDAVKGGFPGDQADIELIDDFTFVVRQSNA